jgi:hypothetical protein
VSAQDEPLELDNAQRDALAGFERDVGVFDELEAEDAARISAWVEHAAATAGAASTTTTVAASTGKAWIVGGVIAATLGAGAVGLWAQPGPRDGEADRLAAAPSMSREPSCASLPPTCDEALYFSSVLPPSASLSETSAVPLANPAAPPLPSNTRV